MVADARRRFRRELGAGLLQLHQATMARVPLLDESVDAVVSTNTIYFVADLDDALAEIARVLRPGGRLALGVGDPQAMADMPFTRHGFILRPVSEVCDHLSGAGFSAIEDHRVGDGDQAPHVIVGRCPP